MTEQERFALPLAPPNGISISTLHYANITAGCQEENWPKILGIHGISMDLLKWGLIA